MEEQQPITRRSCKYDWDVPLMNPHDRPNMSQSHGAWYTNVISELPGIVFFFLPWNSEKINKAWSRRWLQMAMIHVWHVWAFSVWTSTSANCSQSLLVSEGGYRDLRRSTVDVHHRHDLIEPEEFLSSCCSMEYCFIRTDHLCLLPMLLHYFTELKPAWKSVVRLFIQSVQMFYCRNLMEPLRGVQK